MLMRLADQNCIPRRGDAHRIAAKDAQALLSEIPAWTASDALLTRTFSFADFHATMAFVNRVADIAHAQDHHPDMAVSYNRCTVSWNTHDVGGLSLNDFICAAKVDAL